MVFCYKTITESPRRSPRRRRRATSQSLLSELIALENGTDKGCIPEKELRLLAALAKKRKEEDERKKLAEHFNRMWLQEKKERETMEAVTSMQYKTYIHKKRAEERLWHENRELLKNVEHHLEKGQLLDSIRRKERKTEELLAWRDDKKASDLFSRAFEDEARALLAADRRFRQESAAEWRNRMEVEETKRRADDAVKKKNEMLRDSAKRLAITSALHNWESALLRADIEASDAARRAQYSMLATLAEQRGEKINRARELKRRRARAMAEKCELWREAVKMGNF